MTTLRDAVKEALDEAEVGARAATSLWHQIAPNHDSGGFITCINPFCGADIMARFKKLRAALAQEEAGPSREDGESHRCRVCGNYHRCSEAVNGEPSHAALVELFEATVELNAIPVPEHGMIPTEWRDTVDGPRKALARCEREARGKTMETSRTPNRLMQFFKFGHLPEILQEPSKSCAVLAERMDVSLVESAEKTAGLRKLLEAKDCFVRAKLEQERSV